MSPSLARSGNARVLEPGISWNYTTYLLAFLCLAGLLLWRFYRTGGRKMLAMMGGGPDDHPEVGNSDAHHHGTR